MKHSLKKHFDLFLQSASSLDKEPLIYYIRFLVLYLLFLLEDFLFLLEYLRFLVLLPLDGLRLLLRAPPPSLFPPTRESVTAVVVSSLIPWTLLRYKSRSPRNKRLPEYPSSTEGVGATSSEAGSGATDAASRRGRCEAGYKGWVGIPKTEYRRMLMARPAAHLGPPISVRTSCGNQSEYLMIPSKNKRTPSSKPKLFIFGSIIINPFLYNISQISINL